jgi:hypothetical protein
LSPALTLLCMGVISPLSGNSQAPSSPPTSPELKTPPSISAPAEEFELESVKEDCSPFSPVSSSAPSNDPRLLLLNAEQIRSKERRAWQARNEPVERSWPRPRSCSIRLLRCEVGEGMEYGYDIAFICLREGESSTERSLAVSLADCRVGGARTWTSGSKSLV